MKHVIPFRVKLPKKEHYFEIGREVGRGEFVVVENNSFFSILKEIFGQNIHAHGRGFPFPEMCALFAKKAVYTPHNDTLGERWWTRIIRRFLFNRYDKIIVQTPYGKNNLTRQGIKPGKIAVMPNPIDYEFFSKPRHGKEFRKKYGLKRNEMFAVCVGIRKLKNPEVMIEACKMAGIKLVMIDNIHSKHVKGGFYILPPDEIMEDENTVLTGWVTPKEVLSALDAATIFINSSDYECFCLAAYEAASAGVPLCLPKLSVFDAFKDCALFHNSHDANHLAKNIKRYINNIKLRRDNSKKAKQIARRFDYKIVKEKLVGLYREVELIK